ncbi:MAG: electron transport complex subunit RsxC [Candidatus Margulisiibacteriota bacterium]
MFGLKTFRGGVHPKGKKNISQDLPIKEMPLTGEIIIPLSQHTGAPAEPLVKKGDKVLKGQRIGDKEGFITASVHASTSGEVTDIKYSLHPLGNKVLSIFIKPDGKDKWCDLQKTTSLNEITSEGIISKIREAGLVGLGGAAFPTHVKLSPPKDKKIDTLIINAVECEPYLTADYRLMLEEKEKIVLGIKVLLKALKIDKAYLAIESNKPKAIDVMSSAIKGEDSIKLLVMETKYPQGSEKQLIEALTKRQVPVGKLPLDVGVVVQNVGTARAAADAVFDGKPLVERVVTVTGSNIKNPANLRVKIGTKITDIINFCGGPVEEIVKVILGGPMMGIAAPSIEVPVIKGTSGILLMKKKEIIFADPGPCIRCGRCLAVCPMGLAPGRFMESAEAKNYDQAMEDNIINCMECGACTYVCPSRRPMVQWIKTAKSQIQRQLRRKAKLERL